MSKSIYTVFDPDYETYTIDIREDGTIIVTDDDFWGDSAPDEIFIDSWDYAIPRGVRYCGKRLSLPGDLYGNALYLLMDPNTGEPIKVKHE